MGILFSSCSKNGIVCPGTNADFTMTTLGNMPISNVTNSNLPLLLWNKTVSSTSTTVYSDSGLSILSYDGDPTYYVELPADPDIAGVGVSRLILSLCEVLL